MREQVEPSDPEDLARRLEDRVRHLAVEIGERNLSHAPRALERTAEYLEASLAELGHAPRRLPYRAGLHEVANLEALVSGSGGAIVVGAHYDTVPGSPGANDNGTGVAAVLEVARLLAGRRFARPVRFVLFVNEEPPWFLTEAMGSRVYAASLRAEGVAVEVMLSLETIGYYSDAPGSQHYPPLFGRFYPSTGNFIGFVGNLRSRALVRRCHALFQEASDFPAERCATWGAIPGVYWSDHWSFWQEGWRAVMVTDTAPFRYPWYHTGGDTPDRIDFARLARVVEGLAAVVAGLAG